MAEKPTYEELEQRIRELEKEAQETIRESEEKYRNILENIEDGYYEADLAGSFTFFNDSMCKIIGYPKNELMGMNNRQFMDQEAAGEIYQVFNKAYKTGKPVQPFDHEIIRKDGTKRHMEISASLLRDSKGQPIGFRGIARDVTERKQMVAELVKTRNFLQNIFDNSIDGITTTDLHGEITFTSLSVKDLLGYEQDEIVGKKIFTFFSHGIEDAKKNMKQLTTKGELRNHEMKIIKKDGNLIDANLSASLLRDENGEIIGTIGVYKDMTEEKRLEAQLRQAQKLEAIGTLAGGIAHDFNNLLMGIQGYAAMMLLDIDPDHQHYEKLKAIEQQVQSGAKLTKQILGYARKGKYEVKPINLNRLIEETADTFGPTRKEIAIHRELFEDLLSIEADQGQIEQILLNLYVNAADAMPGGGDLFLKTLNVTDRDMTGKPYRPKPGNYCLLVVRDTGIGMDKKTLDRIFDPFFTTKEMGRGTGLGLASAYGIVKAHGGYVDVDSEKGRGTYFSIYLPASKKGEIVKEKKLPEEALKGTETILFVDDEEMIIDVGELLLKNIGYEVLLARSGKEALDLYRENKHKIALVVLDMIMPVMGGGKTYDKLKEIYPDIKVLLSSGYSIDGEAEEILERGCNGFIQKPFTLKEFSQKIREILD